MKKIEQSSYPKSERRTVPFVGVPETIARGMSAYRTVFSRAAGFEQVSRYVSGLLLSENKTLQRLKLHQSWFVEWAELEAVFKCDWVPLDQLIEERDREGIGAIDRASAKPLHVVSPRGKSPNNMP